MRNLDLKIEAINTRNKFINEFVPKVHEIVKPYIENDKKIFLKDGSFIKKISEEISSIKELPKNVRCWFTGGDWSKSFMCDITAKTGDYSVEYLKHNIWFMDSDNNLLDFEPLRCDFTVEEISNLNKEISKKEESIKKLNDDIFTLKSIGSEFFK